VKHVGSTRVVVSMAAATRALGKGYRMVPLVSCFGLEMWFLEWVTMGWDERVGLGISGEEIGEGGAVSEVEDKGGEVSMGRVGTGPWVLVRGSEGCWMLSDEVGPWVVSDWA
jgi:hypothetical protein